MIEREQIIHTLRTAFEPLETVHAMWQGGSAAFGRLDQWSDLDVMLEISDSSNDEIFALAEVQLKRLSPIILQLEIPHAPDRHIHQRFYRLQDTSEFMVIDLAMIDHSAPEKFLQPEIHGSAIVYFDKHEVTARSNPQSKDLTAREEIVRKTFEMFQVLTLKELNRGNLIEAMHFYFSFTLRPLVELLRIRHTLERFDFHTRHIHNDLPADVIERLLPLFFVSDAADLAKKRASAENWFSEL